MRLNRGTIALLLLSVAAIAAVLLINRNPVEAPGAADGTGTPTATPGPLFANLNATTLTRLEILQPETGAKTVLTRSVASALDSATVEFVPTEEVIVTEDPNATEDASATEEVNATIEVDVTEEAAVTNEVNVTEADATDEALPSPTLDPLITPTATLDPNAPIWVISEATNITDRAIDYLQAENAVTVFTALQSAGSFAGESLANFGLETPVYTIIGTATDGSTQRVDVGVQSPTTQRYYVLLNGDTMTVYQVQADQLDSLINLIANPPYIPLPTETPLPSPTPNPFSEVEQTQTAVVEGTAFALTLAAPTATEVSPLVSTAGATPDFSGSSTEEVATVEVVATEESLATEETAP
jgi:hypothetical protein